jgi:hypothetical protein
MKKCFASGVANHQLCKAVYRGYAQAEAHFEARSGYWFDLAAIAANVPVLETKPVAKPESACP